MVCFKTQTIEELGDTVADVKLKRNAYGAWECRVDLGTSSDGSRIRPYKSFPASLSEEEARKQAAAWVESLTSLGQAVNTRLSSLLFEYIAFCKGSGASPNSIKTYCLYARSYISPVLGRKKAEELSSLDLTRFFLFISEQGGKDGAPLSSMTVNGVYQFLRAAWRWFVSMGIVESNPMLAAERPKPRRKEAVSLEEYDLAKLVSYLAVIPDDPLMRIESFGMWVALHTGLRVGEVCGLRVRDVSAIRRFIHVGGTVVEPLGQPAYRKERPKSKTSVRNVTLTAHEMEFVSDYMRWQRLNFSWADGASSAPLVSVDGEFMRPSDLSKAFRNLRKALGLPKEATFHTLRHTHASWCLANGVDLITLSERMGHADPATTARIYGHVLAGRDAAAAEAFEAVAARAVQT